MSNIPEGHYSLNILKEPTLLNKGVVIMSQVDDIVRKFPWIKDRFYLIERRGWRGLNESEHADIKLVEDLSFWHETVNKFPRSICLDIGPADFIDTDSFKPIGLEKYYDGIQVSHWTDFKRPELFIKACGLLPSKRFLKLGHFANGGDSTELEVRKNSLHLAKQLGARIDFPYQTATDNGQFPNSKEEINIYINHAKIGILTTAVEGINRFKMECLSAGVPVLVPSDTSYPTKKHINDKTGMLFEPSPEGLARSIESVLSNIESYNTRDYILKNTGKIRSIRKVKNALEDICKMKGKLFVFENIDWDGRNQSMAWGKDVYTTLNRYK